MVPAPGEPGSETWPKGDQWKTGGAPVWVTGNYDPETNLAFWGTGNGGPWMGDQRPGDNLYVASTVAIDVSDRTDQGSLPVQPERVVGLGRSVAAAAHRLSAQRPHHQRTDQRRAQRLSLVPRAQRRPDQVRRRQAVRRCRTCSSGLDPKTGKPEVDPARKPGTGKRAEFCPGSHGGKNWPPIAFNPQTRMIYIPANNDLCGALTGMPVTYIAGKSFAGTQFGGPPISAPGADHVGGEVQAWNVDTGQRVWRHQLRVHAQLGLDADDGRRARVQRRHQRSQGSRVRRDDRQAALGVRHQLRHRCAADDVHRRRQAVPRGALGLGRRRARDERRDSAVCFRARCRSRPTAAAISVFALP